MSNEKKYTREEINSIVNEALRKAGMNTGKELNMDEMAGVSGGGLGAEYGTTDYEYPYPTTHEEVDQRWNAVQFVKENCGDDVARVLAIKMHVFSGKPSEFANFGTEVYRQRMHDHLDGKVTGLGLWSTH